MKDYTTELLGMEDIELENVKENEKEIILKLRLNRREQGAVKEPKEPVFEPETIEK